MGREAVSSGFPRHNFGEAESGEISVKALRLQGTDPAFHDPPNICPLHLFTRQNLPETTLVVVYIWSPSSSHTTYRLHMISRDAEV